MDQPLNGVAKIPQTHVWNLWSLIELEGPWNLRIRVSYIPNYKATISDKNTCWEGEQFPLSLKLPNINSSTGFNSNTAKLIVFNPPFQQGCDGSLSAEPSAMMSARHRQFLLNYSGRRTRTTVARWRMTRWKRRWQALNVSMFTLTHRTPFGSVLHLLFVNCLSLNLLLQERSGLKLPLKTIFFPLLIFL